MIILKKEWIKSTLSVLKQNVHEVMIYLPQGAKNILKLPIIFLILNVQLKYGILQCSYSLSIQVILFFDQPF